MIETLSSELQIPSHPHSHSTHTHTHTHTHPCGHYSQTLGIHVPRLWDGQVQWEKRPLRSFIHLAISNCSVQFSCSVVPDSLRPYGLQHARPPCHHQLPRVYSNSCPLSLWCHPTISSSVIPFSSHLESFPASGSFQMSQFFSSGDQSIGVSALASVLPMNIQNWFPLGWTGWISLQSKGLSRVFNTTVQKHQFLWRSAFL